MSVFGDVKIVINIRTEHRGDEARDFDRMDYGIVWIINVESDGFDLYPLVFRFINIVVHKRGVAVYRDRQFVGEGVAFVRSYVEMLVMNALLKRGIPARFSEFLFVKTFRIPHTGAPHDAVMSAFGHVKIENHIRAEHRGDEARDFDRIDHDKLAFIGYGHMRRSDEPNIIMHIENFAAGQLLAAEIDLRVFG